MCSDIQQQNSRFIFHFSERYVPIPVIEFNASTAKTILLFNSFYSRKRWKVEVGGHKPLSAMVPCPVQNCIIHNKETYTGEQFEKFDAIIFHAGEMQTKVMLFRGNNHDQLPCSMF